MIGKLGEWKYKLAVGGEVIVDFDNDDKGIGSDSDQIAPLLGLALNQGDTSVIPNSATLSGNQRTGCQYNLLPLDFSAGIPGS